MHCEACSNGDVRLVWGYLLCDAHAIMLEEIEHDMSAQDPKFHYATSRRQHVFERAVALMRLTPSAWVYAHNVIGKP